MKNRTNMKSVVGSMCLVSAGSSIVWGCQSFVVPVVQQSRAAETPRFGEDALQRSLRRWQGSAGETRGARSGTAMMALKDLARKAKEAEVAKDMEALEASEPDNEIFKLLAQAEAGEAVGEDAPEFPLSSLLRKNKGTLSLVAEYRRILKSGFIDGILPPEILVPMLRNGGASCVAVATEKNTGGCTDEDIAAVVKDNKKTEGDFPGPLPIIIRSLRFYSWPSACTIICTGWLDSLQRLCLQVTTSGFVLPATEQGKSTSSITTKIAKAKAAGATGITVGVGLVGSERCGELVQFCKKLGMEAIVQTTSREEIEEAVKAGASIISVVGKLREEAVELKEHIPEEILSVVHVDRRSDEGNDEIEDCWHLRDHGYNTIWASEVLYKAGQEQSESAEAIVKAIRAKSSVQYHRPTGMSGKGEGAKEYLGYLAQ